MSAPVDAAVRSEEFVEFLTPGLERFRPAALTIDADGVLHRGKSLLPGAVELLDTCARYGIPWRIVTNNSRQTASVAAEVYRRLGLPVGDDNVETAAAALAAYIAHAHAGPGRPRVLMLGDRDLRATLRAAGCIVTTDGDSAEWVAVGLDRVMTYARLKRICDAVRSGKRFVVANLDPTIPIEDGAIPGVGSIAAAIAVATGVEPTNIGKPAPEMMLQAAAAMHAEPRAAMHLGDRLDSDVMAARRAGMVAVLVTTGAHTREDALALPPPERPDIVVPDLPTLLAWLVPLWKDS